MFIMHTLL